MKLRKRLMSLGCVSAILASGCVTAFAANNANFMAQIMLRLELNLFRIIGELIMIQVLRLGVVLEATHIEY